FRFIPQLDDVRPAARGTHDHLAGAGLTVQEAVLARMVDVEVVVGVLDGADTPPPAGQLADQCDDQRRLAGVLVAGDAEYMHGRRYPAAEVAVGIVSSNPQGIFAQTLHQPSAATTLPGKIPHGRQASPSLPWICMQFEQS